MSDTMSCKLRCGSSFKLIASIDDIKDLDKNRVFSVGDVIYDKAANREAYVYTDNGEFVKLCASENDTNSALKMKPHPTNCINCGAVLKDYKCEYCGTLHPRYLWYSASKILVL